MEFRQQQWTPNPVLVHSDWTSLTGDDGLLAYRERFQDLTLYLILGTLLHFCCSPAGGSILPVELELYCPWEPKGQFLLVKQPFPASEELISMHLSMCTLLEQVAPAASCMRSRYPLWLPTAWLTLHVDESQNNAVCFPLARLTLSYSSSTPQCLG